MGRLILPLTCRIDIISQRFQKYNYLAKIGKIELPKLSVILAPMEDVTDSPFRVIAKKFGADLVYTEFISSEGLIRDAFKSTRKLDFEEMERPIGIQIFGHQKESMIRAALVSAEANPDFIDINYGCPVRKVVEKGAGAALLKDIPKMIEITKAVIDSVNLPVTIKTRIGWDENNIPIVEVAERMQDIGVQAISIHGRTRSQLYTGLANWDWIGKVKENPRLNIPVFGNGDIDTVSKAIEMYERYGVDGLMIGRGAMGNPWIFKGIKHYLATGEFLESPTMSERVEVCRNHIEASIKQKGETRAINEMRKHYNNYFKGYDNIKPWRMKLVSTNTLDELEKVLADMLEFYS